MCDPSDVRHHIIEGIIIMLGILLAQRTASALFHIPGI